MFRHCVVVVGTVTAVAALGVSGCSHGQPAATPAEPPPASWASTPITPLADAQLPPPEVLTGVLYRLADPVVPGRLKLGLIEGAKPADAAALDTFATAVKNSGYSPLTFEAIDVAWSDRSPGNVVATINTSTPNPDAGRFSFPMEFKSRGTDWQLSQRTAGILLAFGNSWTGAAPGTAPTR